MTVKSETRLVKRIMDILRQNDVFCFKVHGSPFQMSGLPDIVGCHRGRFIAIEVKITGKEPSPLQYQRLKQINRCGGFAFWVNTESKLMEKLNGEVPVFREGV